jgi:hypothetical protein
VSRKRHPHPEIEKAVKYAEARGWEVKPPGKSSHAWGRLYCPHNDPDCACASNCVTSIYGTPASPENYAKLIRRRVEKCTGGQEKRPAESEAQ